MIKEAQDFKDILGKHLVIDDWQAVDILLATVASHRLPGNMLWLRIVGASGTGKTELLHSLLAQEDYCTPGETFTPSAIRRGYKPNGDQLPRMLERWNGKLVITKDFASMLTKDKAMKTEVFGLLRSVWDGVLDADYGSDEGHIHQETHFDWILGTTRYVERQSSLELQLGSRFIDLRWGKPLDYKAAVLKAVSNDSKMVGIRKELADSMASFIASTNGKPTSTIQWDDWLADISYFAATYRTPVERDGQKEVYELPEAEMPTRLGQGFARVADGLATIGIPDYKPYLIRLAKDCLPTKRRAVIDCLLMGIDKQETIGNIICLSQPVVGTIIHDFRLLGFTREKDLGILQEKGGN